MTMLFKISSGLIGCASFEALGFEGISSSNIEAKISSGFMTLDGFDGDGLRVIRWMSS